MLKIINTNRSASYDIPNHFTNYAKAMNPFLAVDTRSWKDLVDTGVDELKVVFGRITKTASPDTTYRAKVRDFGIEPGVYILAFKGDGVISLGTYSSPTTYSRDWVQGFCELTIPESEAQMGATCLFFKGEYLNEVTLCKKEHYESLTSGYKGSEWNPTYIKYLEELGSDGIRTMNLQSINSNRATSPEEMPGMSHPIWTSGVPTEALCHLAEMTDMHLYFHIPTRFTVAGARQMARTLAKHYPLKMVLDLEVGNEFWNTGPDFRSNWAWVRHLDNTTRYTINMRAGSTRISLNDLAGITLKNDDEVVVFTTPKQDTRISNDHRNYDWRLHTGSELKVHLTGDNEFQLLLGPTPIEAKTDQNLSIIVNPKTSYAGRGMYETSVLMNAFEKELVDCGRTDIKVNKIYATQNAAVGLAAYEYDTCPTRPNFDSLFSAPYFETSLLSARVTTKRAGSLLDVDLSVYASELNAEIRVLITAGDDTRPVSKDRILREVGLSSTTSSNCKDYETVTRVSLPIADGRFNVSLTTTDPDSAVLSFTYHTNSGLARDGAVVQYEFEGFESREARSHKSIEETIGFFKEHSKLATSVGLRSGTYEGGTHDWYNMPDAVRLNLQEFYDSHNCENVMHAWSNQLEKAGAHTLAYYKEASRVKCGGMDTCIFGLTSDISEAEKDGRYRWFRSIT